MGVGNSFCRVNPIITLKILYNFILTTFIERSTADVINMHPLIIAELRQGVLPTILPKFIDAMHGKIDLPKIRQKLTTELLARKRAEIGSGEFPPSIQTTPPQKL